MPESTEPTLPIERQHVYGSGLARYKQVITAAILGQVAADGLLPLLASKRRISAPPRRAGRYRYAMLRATRRRSINVTLRLDV